MLRSCDYIVTGGGLTIANCPSEDFKGGSPAFCHLYTPGNDQTDLRTHAMTVLLLEADEMVGVCILKVQPRKKPGSHERRCESTGVTHAIVQVHSNSLQV